MSDTTTDKKVIGMDAHKAKARANASRAELALYSHDGRWCLMLDHLGGDNVVGLQVGEEGDDAVLFGRMALASFFERALAVIAPELSEHTDEPDDDDG